MCESIPIFLQWLYCRNTSIIERLIHPLQIPNFSNFLFSTNIQIITNNKTNIEKLRFFEDSLKDRYCRAHTDLKYYDKHADS